MGHFVYEAIGSMKKSLKQNIFLVIKAMYWYLHNRCAFINKKPCIFFDFLNAFYEQS